MVRVTRFELATNGFGQGCRFWPCVSQPSMLRILPLNQSLKSPRFYHWTTRAYIHFSFLTFSFHSLYLHFFYLFSFYFQQFGISEQFTQAPQKLSQLPQSYTVIFSTFRDSRLSGPSESSQRILDVDWDQQATIAYLVTLNLRKICVFFPNTLKNNPSQEKYVKVRCVFFS